jgi:hypothetical protein
LSTKANASARKIIAFFMTISFLSQRATPTSRGSKERRSLRRGSPLEIRADDQSFEARLDASDMIEPIPVTCMYPVSGSNHPVSATEADAPTKRPVPPVMIMVSAKVVSPVMILSIVPNSRPTLAAVMTDLLDLVEPD